MNENRKIMLVIPSLHGGGAERVAADLMGEFSSARIPITLVLFCEKLVYRIPDDVKIRYVQPGSFCGYFGAIARFFAIIMALRKIIREEMPTHILSFMDYTNVVVLIANMLTSRQVKVALTVHISPSLHLHYYAKSAANRLLSMLMRIFYNRAFRIITVSDFIRNDLINNFAIAKERTVTIYNPVAIREIRDRALEKVDHSWFNADKRVLVAAGRLTGQKGFVHLLKAFSIVRRKIDAYLIILGQGEDEGLLRDLSVRLGIAEYVDFAGFQQNPHKFIKRASVYVLSSLYEGFPMVLLEAMACEVPIVSTMYNPGTNEIIEDEETGLVVPPADDEALAAAIIKLLINRDFGKVLSKKAGQKVEELSVEKIAQQYLKVLFDTK